MPRITPIISALAFAIVVMPVSAQDVTELPDDQLLSAVKDATDAEDADRLLTVMIEVKNRGLLMFPELGQCEIEYPQTEFFENSIFRGAATWAYNTEVWEMAIAQNHCGCRYELRSFDDFIQDVMGRPADTLTIDDYQEIRRYRRGDWNDLAQAYKAFQEDVCGG